MWVCVFGDARRTTVENSKFYLILRGSKESNTFNCMHFTSQSGQCRLIINLHNFYLWFSNTRNATQLYIFHRPASNSLFGIPYLIFQCENFAKNCTCIKYVLVVWACLHVNSSIDSTRIAIHLESLFLHSMSYLTESIFLLFHSHNFKSLYDFQRNFDIRLLNCATSFTEMRFKINKI